MLITLALIAAISLPPKPAQYVTDRAGVLPNAAALNQKLADFERQTSDQILVYVDQHLPPETTIEEMGSEAIHEWGVGQKGKDNGAILFVFVADHRMRIEVGYGLEGSLTDAKSKQITSTVIKPAFQKGDYAGGIERGVDAILATIKDEPYKGTGKTVAQSAAHGAAGCLAPLIFFAIFGFIIFAAIFGRKRGWVTVTPTASSGDSFSSSDSSDSGSSSSDSSDSFDGGGGDSGGGGASDSW